LLLRALTISEQQVGTQIAPARNPQDTASAPFLLRVLTRIRQRAWSLLSFLSILPADNAERELIHHYYTALTTQDYLTAFEDLSPRMRTAEGEPITPDWFRQQEQAVEAASGNVSGHTITNWTRTASHFFSFQMTQASYTVKVVRGSRSEYAYPYLVKEDAQWKILRFDACQQRFF
jgi:hypothetical protein